MEFCFKISVGTLSAFVIGLLESIISKLDHAKIQHSS